MGCNWACREAFCTERYCGSPTPPVSYLQGDNGHHYFTRVCRVQPLCGGSRWQCILRSLVIYESETFVLVHPSLSAAEDAEAAVRLIALTALRNTFPCSLHFFSVRKHVTGFDTGIVLFSHPVVLYNLLTFVSRPSRKSAMYTLWCRFSSTR
ncbi:hypothetical protein E2C01_058510 [Portunus trituberculatus]|uniref:Uncharacterized protein n=1 Tax=Portunus trituberculatus TaxID=210409 RepID=A0A5B7H3Y0_PORTR|nr:hypothetical protein [Portunus trituberculatus]